MKKFILTLIVVFYLGGMSTLSAQNDTFLSAIRYELFYDKFDLKKTMVFYEKLTKSNIDLPIITAYEASAKALLANYSWNPVSKISYLKESKVLLEEAVEKDMNNIEIRFLRFYIENSIPAILGLSKNLEEDKSVILKNIQNFNKDQFEPGIVEFIIGYMTSPDILDKEEIETVKARIGQLTD